MRIFPEIQLRDIWLANEINSFLQMSYFGALLIVVLVTISVSQDLIT